MSKLVRYRLIGFAGAIVLFLVDQAMKGYVTQTLAMERGDVVELLPFFDFRLTYNFGVSLGMFQADSMEMRWILVGVTSLIALVVTVWMLREKALGEIAGLSLILGGALGNIKDRYELGYVIDYADLHFGEFRPFLIFNIADAAITIGVLIILARAFFVRDKEATPEHKSAPGAAES
ncbi:signal peptidase II [Pelagerythrobacter aerophilus]|uniref:Lipoprotein signal peptidase n=1 Tax=Pelagerythrobacter aerophilus TaxID=2306995 RepID=A0A418NGQ7_9SPHN|nr:signal peptidase II [Pelagerythrobacter aerophilus]RIV77513.1 signal peptidase II [Pelagerythrobacter aerophilus]